MKDRQLYIIITVCLLLVFTITAIFISDTGLAKISKLLLVIIFLMVFIILKLRGKSSFAYSFLLFISILNLAMPTIGFQISLISSSNIFRQYGNAIQLKMLHLVILLFIPMLLVKIIKDRISLTKNLNLLGMFLCVAFLSSYLLNNINPQASIIAFFVILSMYLFVLVVFNIVSFERFLHTQWWAFALIIMLETLLVIAFPILDIEAAATIFTSSAAEWITRGDDTFRAVGSFDHPGYFGIFLSLLVPLFMSSYLYGYYKKISLVLLIMLLFDIFFTFSRTSLVVAIIAMVGSFILASDNKSRIIKSLKILSIFVVTIFFAILVIYQTDFGQRLFLSENFEDMWFARYYHWMLGVEILKDYPLLGVGINVHLDYFNRFLNISDQSVLTSSFAYSNPIHNIHLIMLAEVGIVGYLLWIAVYLRTILLSLKWSRESNTKTKIAFSFAALGSIVMLVYGFFGWAPIRPEMWYFFGLLLVNFEFARTQQMCMTEKLMVTEP